MDQHMIFEDVNILTTTNNFWIAVFSDSHFARPGSHGQQPPSLKALICICIGCRQREHTS